MSEWSGHEAGWRRPRSGSDTEGNLCKLKLPHSIKVAANAGAVDRLHTPAARLIHGHVLKEESDNVDVAAEASTVNGLVVRAVFFPH